MRLGTRRQLTAGIATLGLALGSLAILPPLPASAAPPVTLTFLNFNDFHGRIDDPASPPAAATADGTSKWASTISRLRAAAETANGAGTVALMSAGDNWGASLFNSFIANDQPTIDVLNEMDVAAASTGNHEFDRGWPYLRDNVLNNPDPAKRPEFPLLGANVYDAGTGVPVMQEYVVLNLSGVRVGVIGAVTQDVPSLVSPAGIQGLSFGDPVDAVNRVAAQLSDGNNGNGEADVIVAEYHEGAPLPQSAATLDQQVAAGGPFAKIVLQTSPAVDVIFNGHSHQPYAYLAPVPGEPGNTRPVVQTGNYGDRIGQVTIAVDASADAVPGSATATLVVQDDSANDALPHVAQVRAIVAAAAAFASIVGAQPVGAVTADVTTAFSGGGYTGPGGTYVGPTRDDRSKESALGGLVANALRDTLSDPLMGGAQIGVVNPGGLRAELFSAPDGVSRSARRMPCCRSPTTCGPPPSPARSSRRCSSSSGSATRRVRCRPPRTCSSGSPTTSPTRSTRRCRRDPESPRSQSTALRSIRRAIPDRDVLLPGDRWRQLPGVRRRGRTPRTPAWSTVTAGSTTSVTRRR